MEGELWKLLLSSGVPAAILGYVSVTLWKRVRELDAELRQLQAWQRDFLVDLMREDKDRGKA